MWEEEEDVLRLYQGSRGFLSEKGNVFRIFTGEVLWLLLADVEIVADYYQRC